MRSITFIIVSCFLLLLTVIGLGALYLISDEGVKDPAPTLSRGDLSNWSFGVIYDRYGSHSWEEYLNLNGKNYGPYEYIVGPIALSDKSFGFAYLEDSNSPEERYVNINDETFGPYYAAYMVSVSDSGYGFVYGKEGGNGTIDRFLNMNGEVHELGAGTKKEPVLTPEGLGLLSYPETGDPRITTINGNTYGSDEIRFGVGYSKDDGMMVNINDKKYGPYPAAGSVFISNESFGFEYWRDDDLYVNVNETVYGPYYACGLVSVSDDGFLFLYSLGEEDDRYFNLNGTTYGPYEITHPIYFPNAGGILYKDNGKWYVNVNGEVRGT